MLLEIIANLLKMKYRNISFTKVFPPLSQYFVEAPLAVITAVSISGSLLVSIIFKVLQALSNWMLIIARQPFSGLAIDFQVDLKSKL